MGLFKRLRRRFSGSNFDARVGCELEPQALRERQRAERGWHEAGPAAEWSADITRQNQEIADAYSAEERRRMDLFERGEYTPRFGSVENDMMFEMRNRTVTGLQPALPALSPLEFKQAATVSDLTSEIQVIERGQQDRTVTMPARPSKREVLDRVGGDETKAAQVEQRLDELFGAEA